MVFQITKNCDYKLPDGFKLLKRNNEYIIEVPEEGIGREFLVCHRTAGFTSTITDIATPTMFPDSCTAKGALKEYLYDPIKGFK